MLWPVRLYVPAVYQTGGKCSKNRLKFNQDLFNIRMDGKVAIIYYPPKSIFVLNWLLIFVVCIYIYITCPKQDSAKRDIARLSWTMQIYYVPPYHPGSVSFGPSSFLILKLGWHVGFDMPFDCSFHYCFFNLNLVFKNDLFDRRVKSVFFKCK